MSILIKGMEMPKKGSCSDDETKLMLRCPTFSTKPKSQANADRIRAMTDEELAEWLAERSTSPNCTGKCHKDYEVYGELRTFCHDCWLDYLKQEATNA